MLMLSLVLVLVLVLSLSLSLSLSLLLMLMLLLLLRLLLLLLLRLLLLLLLLPFFFGSLVGWAQLTSRHAWQTARRVTTCTIARLNFGSERDSQRARLLLCPSSGRRQTHPQPTGPSPPPRWVPLPRARFWVPVEV